MLFQPQFEELIAFASDAVFMPELLKAKSAYFSATGEVFEDDAFFEQQMAAFINFYLFDWKLDGDQLTPAERFWRDGRFATPDDAPIFESFLETWLSLWEVRKLGKASVRLRDLFTDRDVEVFERRQLIGLTKGDLMEARLAPMGDKFVFMRGSAFHPSAARKSILAEIKRLKKQAPSFDTRDFICVLSRMRLKFERSRNIAAEQIYNFSRK
ncbi:MAG: hypothetical protein LBM75_10595 [Myxococcales bacterium]|nr:hypothetical protein [Myxococcales bacterium]